MALTTRDRANRSRDALADLNGFFLRSLAAPSEVRPTVRCLSRGDTRALIVQARKALIDAELRGYSADALLELLEKSHILSAVPVVGPSDKAAAMYVVGAQPLATLNPLELLQAAEPRGLICYFSALAYYGLTTQSPAHHHIARLNARPPAPLPVTPRPAVTVSDSAPRRERLGTLLFNYQSVPYYRTSRAAYTVAGIQLRQLNDRSLIRITTREQTLLDTLHRPISCGGSNVVWEAWQTGVSDLDETRLCEHLATLADPKYPRRVGYLLSSLGYVPGPQLQALLDETLRHIQSESDAPLVPLFPGLPTVSVDPTWRLKVPVA